MNCEQALILISAALDGEITRSEREQLNSHLDLCAECRSIAEDFGLMSAALAEETELPAGLTERMETALRSADQRKKPAFLRRYGSMVAMLALVISLGAIALSGGGRNDTAAFDLFDAKMMEAEAAPAGAAPVPSVASYAKGSANGGSQNYVIVTADSAAFDVESVAEEALDAGAEKPETKGEATIVENAAPLQPPTAEEPQQFDPPDHATLSYALQMVMNDLAEKDGLTEPPVEEEYYYCVLGRTENEETRLEYTGLSPNGKYMTFSLTLNRVPADGAQVGPADVTWLNNFAVSTRRDEVLREYDENRSVEHLKRYRAAISD